MKAERETKTVSKRPTRDDADVILAAAKAFAPQIKRWFDAGGDSVSVEEIEGDLAVVCRRSGMGADGFDLAKSLERSCGYSGDSDLVEILDEFHWVASAERDKAIRAWIDREGITPQFSIGDSIRFKWNRDVKIGVIERVTEYGSYVVNTGENGKPYCNWEDAETP